MHPSRLAERGYNHAGVLASDLARLWSMDAPISAALIRIRATGQQVGQDYLARQANMQNAFAADSALLGGRPVLILDDVCTTGATLNACAQAVLEAGAARVNCLTIARA
jgi:ComF family protein